MAPLLSEWVEPFRKAVDELVDTLAQGLSVRPSHDLDPSNQVSTAEVTDALLEIAFSILRASRESYDSGRWDELKTKIDKLVRLNGRHSDGTGTKLHSGRFGTWTGPRRNPHFPTGFLHYALRSL